VSVADSARRSPIALTPFLSDGTIDAGSLGVFIRDAYRDAGFTRGEIDSGAVILTGEAIKRKNARAIDELFAEEAGKFVCATAGHKLECRLAELSCDAGAVATAHRRLEESRTICGQLEDDIERIIVRARIDAVDAIVTWRSASAISAVELARRSAMVLRRAFAERETVQGAETWHLRH